MAKFKAADVDGYIALCAPDAQPHLKELRKLIQSTIPDAEEKIWYNVPFFFYHGELVGFDALTNHVSFGIGPDVFSQDVRTSLEEKGYKTGKGTFQIKFDQKIPVTIVRQLLKAKAKWNREKEK